LNIYSEWLRTFAPQTTVLEFAESVGTSHPVAEVAGPSAIEAFPSEWRLSPSAPFDPARWRAIVSGERPTESPGGAGWVDYAQRAIRHQFRGYGVSMRLLTFASERRTGWEESKSEGVWTVAIASFVTTNPADGRFVGVLSSERSLTADVIQDAEDTFRIRGGTERLSFSLRNLLAAQALGVECLSARLSSGNSSVLIKADSGDAFRAVLQDTEGDISGLTVNANDQRATVLENGEIIFGGDAPIGSVLSAVTTIMVASVRLQKSRVH
jgi:hypothetical protein